MDRPNLLTQRFMVIERPNKNELDLPMYLDDSISTILPSRLRRNEKVTHNPAPLEGCKF